MRGLKLASIIACAVALCFSLAACGGGSSSSASASAGTSASASASASASVSAAPANENVAGEWKLAAAQAQGITIAGDFSMVFGTSDPTTLTLNADGTGTMSLAGSSTNLTWTKKGDDAISLEADGGVIDAVCKDGAVVLNMSDEEFSGELVFTKDGTYADVKQISSADAKPITSEDALVGTWRLSGMGMGGATMYGDASSLAQLSGQSNMDIVLEKGGSGTAFGAAATWSVSADGASITIDGANIPLMAYGDDIMLNATGFAGNLDLGGAEMLFLFSK